MNFKFKPGDLVSRSLKNFPILFILGYEYETEYCHAQYKYYNLQYPESICSIERSVLDRCFIKVNV